IVPRHQLVKLSAARDVLVLESLGATFFGRPEEPLHHRVVDCCELAPCAWKETSETTVALPDRARLRRPRWRGRSLLRDSIVAFATRALSCDGPQGVGEVLLHEWDF